MNTKFEVDDEKINKSDLLSSWGKRKQAVLREQQEIEQQQAEKNQVVKEENFLTDEDMPSIESLTADSDYSCFMSPKVSHALRRLALRKLFHGAQFNICDGLDDYDGDYTSFAKLGNIVTSDMKHQIEVAMRKKQQLLEQQAAEARLDNEASELADKASSVDESSIEDSESEDMQAMDDHIEDTVENDDIDYTAKNQVENNDAEDNDEFEHEDKLDRGLPG